MIFVSLNWDFKEYLFGNLRNMEGNDNWIFNYYL